MDRDHPGWRLEDGEKGREVIPDLENAAVHVTDVDRLLPNAGIEDVLRAELDEWPPQSEQSARFRLALDWARIALAAAALDEEAL